MATSTHRTTFGKTGFQVSRLGFGAAPAAYLKADRDHAARLLGDILDSGVNLIDTASSYPGSHAFLGEYLSPRRNDFVLVSKCGGKIPEITGTPWSAEYTAAQIDLALQLLNTDVIDVMLLHSCDLPTLKSGDALSALLKARDAGKIRFAGYSGDNEAAAWAAEQEDIAVIETSVNLVDQRNIDLLLPTCVANNVAVLAKRPIANACWKDISTQQGIYKNYVAEYSRRFASMNLSPIELGFPDSPASWPEIALRFTLSQPGVHTAIVGTTNPANFAANLSQIAKGPLPADTLTRIRAAFHKADPAASWLGLT